MQLNSSLAQILLHDTSEGVGSAELLVIDERRNGKLVDELFQQRGACRRRHVHQDALGDKNSRDIAVESARVQLLVQLVELTQISSEQVVVACMEVRVMGDNGWNIQINFEKFFYSPSLAKLFFKSMPSLPIGFRMCRIFLEVTDEKSTST